MQLVSIVSFDRGFHKLLCIKDIQYLTVLPSRTTIILLVISKLLIQIQIGNHYFAIEIGNSHKN